MSYAALVSDFADRDAFPIAINEVINWIRTRTDHDIIKLHPVDREHKSYRGAFRRRAISIGGPYSDDIEIRVDIVFGAELHPHMKRLVICKELLHVFDAPKACVNTAEKVRSLIPAMNVPGEIPIDLPFIMDKLGVYRALAVLMPTKARKRLAEAVSSGARTVEEVATHVALPTADVDLWLRLGDAFEIIIGVAHSVSEEADPIAGEKGLAVE
ncbi:hypothetical protein [Gluconobacter sp. GP1]|uniref:hypothetical protein n=1 Tax=Gluconobacter sp. GP1 TaxID=3046423 RepID=UPI00293E7A43|nr:hypothetical protein [Gluconobacter sp. GP1]